MTGQSQALRAISFRDDYRSDRADLVKDFYLPALTASSRYDRAVGYFSASVLAVLGQGLDDFATRGGYVRIVASPQLRPEDVAQIQAGYALRGVLERAALRDLEEASVDALAATGLGKLGMLVADGRLDMKLAYICAENRVGIYHEKIGIFRDNQDIVAFKGSANETLPGLVGNFESIEVFRSWHPGDGDRAARIGLDFEDLWFDRTEYLRVFSFTEVAKPFLDQYGNKAEGADDSVKLTDRGTLVDLPPPETDGLLAIPGELNIRDYQKHAVQAWFNNSCRGILRMATGTGKTIAALAAAAQLSKRLRSQAGARPMLTVIVVPLQHLVDQWAEDVERFGLVPIRAYESTNSWYPRATYLIEALALETTSNGVIVTTNATFSKDRFQGLLKRHRSHLLVIADEVHNLGARQLSNLLPEAASFRLGLSATPERWFDDEGTAALQRYFGDVVFDMDIGGAIKVGALCRYTYTPILIALDDDEIELYGRVTEAIAKAFAAREFTDDADADGPLGKLLRKRASILGHARGKLSALREEVSQRKDDWFQLLYCAEGRHPLAADPHGPTHGSSQLQQAMKLVGQDLRMPTAAYTSETSRKQRRNVLRRFESGNEIQVIASMRCLDEGVDVPAARTAYLLASSSNPRQFVQRRGRVLRRAPGKTHADIVDFIVIPPESVTNLNRETERRMVARELTRVSEFARFADNEAETLDTLRPLRLRFGLLDT
ncbi:DEAD/DEAH box helicase family protein [Streptodolium elevatio]